MPVIPIVNWWSYCGEGDCGEGECGDGDCGGEGDSCGESDCGEGDWISNDITAQKF